MIKNKKTNKKTANILIAAGLLLLSGWNYFIKYQEVNNFDLNRNAKISYSNHAECRMDCRHIDASEIREVLQDGKINKKKSHPNKGTIAIEAKTHDDQDVRVVFAKKGDKLHVVTCIDLDTDWDCNCY